MFELQAMDDFEQQPAHRLEGVLRPRFKDWVHSSSLLQGLYAVYREHQARKLLAQGRRYQALKYLLHAQRHVSAESFGQARVRFMEDLIRSACWREGKLSTVEDNLFRQEFVRSAAAVEMRWSQAALPLHHRVRMRQPRPDDDPERQGNLIVLKRSNPDTGERGVVLLKYNAAIIGFPALFDLPRFARDYMMVLEPSHWGYQHERFFPYLGADLDVVVLAQYGPDFDYIRGLESNLAPLRLGPSDWADPDLFQQKNDHHRTYDIVMVAAWSALKRHELLFQALARLKAGTGRRFRTVLIGYPWDWTQATIRNLIGKYGLETDISVFERIPHAQVAAILADSKVSLFLSKAEGSPKALHESIFTGTPVIVYRGNRGINLDQITEQVGLLAGDTDLPQALLKAVDGWESFNPRAWALEHTGYRNSCRILNDVLRSCAGKRAAPWTRDMVAKKNAPHLRYALAGQYLEFETEYERLAGFLLPPG